MIAAPSQPPTSRTPPPTLSFAAWAAVIMVLINAVATPLMLSSVNVALPSMARALNLDAVTVTWVPLVYLMAAVACILPSGRLADRIGRRRVFIIGIVGVVVASVFASRAWDGPSLLLGRALQGLFTAMLYATQVAIVSSVVPPAVRGRYLGYTVSAIYIGLTLGPALGGYWVESFSWRVAMLLHLPLSLLSLLMAAVVVKAEWRAEPAPPFDMQGSLLYGLGLSVLLFGLVDIASLLGVAAVLLGLALLIGFRRHEARQALPLLDLDLMIKSPTFGRSALTAYLMYAATFGNVVLVSLQLQYLHGASPSAAGQVMLIQPLTMTLLAPLFGRWSDRIDAGHFVRAGLYATTLGLVVLCSSVGSDSLTPLIFGLCAVGLGFSLFTAPNTNAVMSAVPRESYGAAAGVIATMRLLGQLSSQGLVVLAFAWVLGPIDLGSSERPDLMLAVRLAYALAALALIPAFRLTHGRRSIQ